MATVIQKPDNLSLLGNLKKYVISASQPVRFTLKRGQDIVIDESYTPINGTCEVDVKRVLETILQVALPTSDIFEQTALAVTFTAYVDDSSVGSFTCVRAGVDIPAVNASSFLNGNWLTWQPQTKHVRRLSPEYLTYYFQSAAIVKVRYYAPNDESNTITLHTGASGHAYTYNMQFAHMMSLEGVPEDAYGFYDVWVETASGTRLTYVQRFVWTQGVKDDEYYVFANSLGGLDGATFYGDKSSRAENEYAIAEYEDTMAQSTVSRIRKYSKNTGHLTSTEASWLRDFVNSRHIYVADGSTMRQVVLDETNAADSSAENLSSYDFTFRFASDKGFLNIARSADALPHVLEIVVPDQEIFFLEARLFELPEAALSDGTLFPVQAPFLETWSKVTWGTIHSSIMTDVAAAIAAAMGGATGTVTAVRFSASVPYTDGSDYSPEQGSTVINLPSYRWQNIQEHPTTVMGYGITDAIALGSADVTRIQSGDDLNSYRTPGTYISGSASISASLLNSPYTATGFKLVVMYVNSGDYLWQELYTGGGVNRVYRRKYNNGSWTVWQQYLNEGNTGLITSVGTIASGVWHGTAVADAYIASSSAWNTAAERAAIFAELFEKDTTSVPGTTLIKAKFALYSNNPITAGGIGTSGGGGGGTVTGISLGGGTPYTPSSGSTIINLPAYPTTLPASDVSAWAKKASLAASDVPTLAISKISGLQSALDGKQATISDLSTIRTRAGEGHTAYGYFTNDKLPYSSISGAPTSLPASDVYDWAKAATKPSYAFSEITDKPTTLNGYGITDAFSLNSNVTSISSGDDLNDYTTAGVYRSGSASISASLENCPYTGAGFKLVVMASISTSYLWQEIYAGGAANSIYRRKYNNGSWTAWYLYYHAGNLTKSTLGLGNVENTALSTWHGTNNITTLGTITTGVWHGTAIADEYIASSADWNLAAERAALFAEMFEKESYTEEGQTKYRIKVNPQYSGLYSYGFLTSGGIGTSGGGGGGTVTGISLGGSTPYTPSSGSTIINLPAYPTASSLGLGSLAYKSSLDSSDIPNISASKITSGTLGTARIPSLEISKINGLQSALDGKQATISDLSTIRTQSGEGHTAYGYFASGKLAWSKVSGTPTTVSGYGITDAITTANIGAQSVNYAASAGSVAWANVTGHPTSFPASDVYDWAKAATKPSYAFSEITGTPTTLIGYGITDGWNLSNTSVPRVRENDDLDDYKTAGTFICSSSAVASSLSHCPLTTVFKLVVYNVAGTIYFRQDLYQGLGTNRLYSRNYNNGTWTSWYVHYHSGNSNSTSVAWSASSLTLAGAITGATTGSFSGAVTTPRLNIADAGYITSTSAGNAYINVGGTTLMTWNTNENAVLRGTAAAAVALGTATYPWASVYSKDYRIIGTSASGSDAILTADGSHNCYVKANDAIISVWDGVNNAFRRGSSNSSVTLGTATYPWVSLYATSGIFGGTVTADTFTISSQAASAHLQFTRAKSANYIVFPAAVDGSNATLRLATSAGNSGTLMTIRSDGWLGLGTYQPSSKFDIYDAGTECTLTIRTGTTTGTPGIILQRGTATDGYMDWQMKNGGSFVLSSRGSAGTWTDRINVSSAGNVGIGIAAPTEKLDVAGHIHSTTGIYCDSWIVAGGQYSASDARLKDNIVGLSSDTAIATIMKLNPCSWSWKKESGMVGKSFGFVAQDVERILPSAIGKVRDINTGERLTLCYDQLHAFEVSVIQSLERRVRELERRLNQS